MDLWEPPSLQWRAEPHRSSRTRLRSASPSLWRTGSPCLDPQTSGTACWYVSLSDCGEHYYVVIYLQSFQPDLVVTDLKQRNESLRFKTFTATFKNWKHSFTVQTMDRIVTEPRLTPERFLFPAEPRSAACWAPARSPEHRSPSRPDPAAAAFSEGSGRTDSQPADKQTTEHPEHNIHAGFTMFKKGRLKMSLEMTSLTCLKCFCDTFSPGQSSQIIHGRKHAR